MDFSPLFQPLLGALWYLIPLFVLAAVIKSPWFKGKVGEAIVNLSAHFLLDRKTYHLILNVTLPTEDGATQIDHLIVSPHGVFVVETKNMKGWIFGGAKQRFWTQKIFGIPRSLRICCTRRTNILNPFRAGRGRLMLRADHMTREVEMSQEDGYGVLIKPYWELLSL